MKLNMQNTFLGDSDQNAILLRNYFKISTRLKPESLKGVVLTFTWHKECQMDGLAIGQNTEISNGNNMKPRKNCVYCSVNLEVVFTLYSLIACSIGTRSRTQNSTVPNTRPVLLSSTPTNKHHNVTQDLTRLPTKAKAQMASG